MKVPEHEGRDWAIIAVIILIGFVCVLLAGYWALRFAPSWQLTADMESKLDPNSDFLTRRPGGFVEPVDPSILTQPVWINVFLTPGAIFSTRPPNASTTPALFLTPTRIASATQIFVASATHTSTLVYFPPTRTATSYPANTRTPIFTSAPTNASTATMYTSTFTATATPTTTSTPSYTPTNITPPEADLQITKDDNATTYVSNGTLTYTVTVANSGPSAVVGAVIADNIPSSQVSSWTWACSSQNGGANGCDPVSNSSGNFSDMVNLPNGATIVYTVTANISPSASGNLTNNASISPPAGITDLILGNNYASDTDQIVVSSSFPNGNINTTPDNQIEVIPPGSSVTLMFDSPLIVGGHVGWDLVMYELPNGTGIAMDLIQLEISDGYNWYTVLNWGDNIPDTNSNMNIGDPLIGGVENDNRGFTTIPNSDVLYPFGTGTLASPATGVVMELDGFVPNGIYYYIRITSPAGGLDGGCEVDAITVLP